MGRTLLGVLAGQHTGTGRASALQGTQPELRAPVLSPVASRLCIYASSFSNTKQTLGTCQVRVSTTMRWTRRVPSGRGGCFEW